MQLAVRDTPPVHFLQKITEKNKKARKHFSLRASRISCKNFSFLQSASTNLKRLFSIVTIGGMLAAHSDSEGSSRRPRR
jgi:hypothetical protein